MEILKHSENKKKGKSGVSAVATLLMLGVFDAHLELVERDRKITWHNNVAMLTAQTVGRRLDHDSCHEYVNGTSIW
jgi:exonuclease III